MSVQTNSVPAVATDEAGTVPCNWVLLMNVVGMANETEFGTTTISSPDTNPVPKTFNVKPPLPTPTVSGLRLLRVRNGGTVTLIAFDVKGPGFEAVMETGPGVLTRLVGATFISLKKKAAVNGPRFVAFQLVVAPGSNPEPFTAKIGLSRRPVDGL